MIAALTAGAGKRAVARLVEDHAAKVRRTTIVIAEEVRVAEESNRANPRIGTMFCLRTPAGMTRDEMLEYWGSSHKRLVLSLQRSLGYRAYDQLHARSDSDLTALVELFGGHVGEEFDGVALLVYKNQFQLIRGFLNPFTQISNLKLVKDEVGFIDGQRSSLVFGREYLFENR